MSQRLILLCHAPLAGPAGDRRQPAFPSPDTPIAAPITATGNGAGDGTGDGATLAALAHALGRVDALVHAPERRARETAAALAGLQMPPAATPREDAALRDLDHGRWAGRRLGDVLADLTPDAAAAWLCDPTAAPHGGESVAQLLERAAAWLAALTAPGAPPVGCLLAVTHPAVARALVVRALDAPPTTFWRIDMAPLSRVDLRHHAGRWTLRVLDAPLTAAR